MSNAPVFPLRPVLSVAGLALLLSACAAHTAPQLDWLPDATGWTVRDVDESEPPTWVAYHREAPEADVKEIRVVGPVDTTPDVTMAALRHRLLDEAYVPDGLELEILFESEDEVVTYGLARMPWPFRDREVTERMVFSHDPETGEFRVDVQQVDSEDEVPRGVVRVPLVRNAFVVTPTVDGTSVLTADSVHDLGGSFPNGMVYGPVRNGMIDLLFEVRAISLDLQP
ncbi:MAG: hypothetical protein AAGA48_36520 [Myxococcota bacterium]